MIGRTLGLYIAFRFSKIMLAMLVGLLLIIITVDFVEQVRKSAEMVDASLIGLLLISITKAPIFIERAFPFAGLFAAMITLTQLNQKMELVVARAAGVSAWQFLMPISLAAALIGLFAAFAYNPVAVAAFEKSKEIEAAVFNQAVSGQPLHTVRDHWIKQDETQGYSIINAGMARRFGAILGNVRIFRIGSNGEMIERIDAKSATFGGNRWVLQDAVVSRGQPGTEVVPRMVIPSTLTADILAGVTSTADSVPFWNLRNIAAKAQLSGANANPFLMQFYSLLTLPIFLIAMVLIAATVTLRFARFGQVGRLILGGILCGFLLYTLTQMVTSLGSNGIVPPVLAALSPSVVAIFFGFSILLQQEDG